MSDRYCLKYGSLLHSSIVPNIQLNYIYNENDSNAVNMAIGHLVNKSFTDDKKLTL